MCRRVHERQRIAGARNVGEAAGGRKQFVVMERSVCWSRGINSKVTRLVTEGAFSPAQCDGMVKGVSSSGWQLARGVEQGLAPERRSARAREA
jgi:hypothetical protein